MDKKKWLIVLGLVAVWFFFIRKRSSRPGAIPVAAHVATHPAVPMSANQQIAFAAVKAAPQVAKAIGSFFSSPSTDEDSAAMNEDEDEED